MEYPTIICVLTLQPMKKNTCLIVSFLLLVLITRSQQPSSYNLYNLTRAKKLTLVHRTAQPLKDGKIKGVRLSQDTSEGLAWLNEANFSFGSVEFDVKGKDEFQRSFVGIAFNGQNDSTYEAIYFRPFNFLAKDSVRRVHAVQYIAHPQFTWRTLREDATTNARFEKAVTNPPDPNGWFHVKVEVSKKEVQVFINNRSTPEMACKRLVHLNSGKIGLFAGDGSGGDFANLIITN
jgi:hypothetical protein